MTVCAAVTDTLCKGRRQNVPEHSLRPVIILGWATHTSLGHFLSDARYRGAGRNMHTEADRALRSRS